ncbi:MAG: hypothetical protein ABUS56_07635 [Acidobacteriota bacterium]
MQYGAGFADILEQELRAVASPAPAAVRAEPRYPPAPPSPFLFSETQRHFGAAAYGWSGRGPTRLARPPIATPRPQPVSDRPRSRRVLTGRQQDALATLNRLGAGLAQDFTVRELRSAFRTLARRYHPDRHPGGTPYEAAQLSRLFADVTGHYRRLLALFDPAVA